MGSSICNFVILKLYMGDIGLRVDIPDNEKASCRIECSTNVAVGQVKEPNVQIFSPTTKYVLEEISSSIDQNAASLQPLSMKRRLAFKKSYPPIDEANSADTTNRAVDQSILLIDFDKAEGYVDLPSSVVKVEKTPNSTHGMQMESSQMLERPVKKDFSREKGSSRDGGTFDLNDS